MTGLLFKFKIRLKSAWVLSLCKCTKYGQFPITGAHPCICDRNAFNRPNQCSFLSGNFNFIASNLHRELQLGFIAYILVALEMASLLERQLRSAGEACLPLVSSFKHWQVEMEVGVGVLNKGLCLSSPWEERDLSVMISWFPKVFFSPEHFKLLTKMRTWVFCN